MKRRVKILICMWLVFMFLLGTHSFVSGGKIAELRVWAPAGRLERVVELFNERWPNIKVDLVVLPPEILEPKLLASIAAGVAPDVVMINSNSAPYFNRGAAFAELTGEYHKYLGREYSISANVINLGMFDGEKIYQIPFSAYYLVLFYNKDLFDRTGVSAPDRTWTWDTLLDRAIRLTRDTDRDGEPVIYGIAGLDHLPLFATLVWQNEGAILSEDGSRSMLDSPEAIEALRFLVQLQMVSPHWLEIRERFIAGQVAMYTSGTWDLNEIRQSGLDLGMTLIPRPEGGRDASFVWAEQLAIPNLSKNKDAAWEFIRFGLSREVQRDVLGLTNTIRADLIAESPGELPRELRDTLQRAMQVARAPSSIHYRELSGILEEAIRSALWEGVSPEEALNNASAEIDRILR